MTDPNERAELARNRADAVRAYCSRICPPDAVPEAMDAVFAAMEERDQDALLREATRIAAAERAATPGAASQRGRSSLRARIADATGISACEVMPRLLAARASGTLSPQEDRRMARHLQSCTACQMAELRFVEAEHAFDVEREGGPVEREGGPTGERDSRTPPDNASRLYREDGEEKPATAPERARPVWPGSERSAGVGVPRASSPPEPIERRWAERRGILVGLAAALLLASAVLAASLNLSDEPTAGETQPTGDPGAAPVDDSDPGRAGNARPLPEPESITVSVLNGAEVDFLASDTADALEEEGFEIIVVADAPRSVQETFVIHDGENKQEAQRVARELDVSDIRSVDEGQRAATFAAEAGGADAVVVTGPDAQQ